MPDNSTDIFITNIIDYYIDRPLDMEGISLFKFASWYKISLSETTEVSSRCCQRIKLLSLNKIMQKRRKAAIIRTPKFQGNSEQYYYAFLMLHLPFRNENNLLQPFSSLQEAFIQKNHLFYLSDMQFDAYLHDVERTVRIDY